jgi:uncharacterized membrane protein YfhO
VISGSGDVLDWGRTTSRAFAKVQLRTPGALVFNQNHAPGWQSSLGRVHADQYGRLQVSDLPAGVHRVALRYRPPLLWPSMMLSALGVLCASLLATRGRLWSRSKAAGPAGGIEKRRQPG